MEYHRAKKPKSDGLSASELGSGKNYRSLSRAMSWALRHAAPKLGISMTADGYVSVKEMLNCGSSRFKDCTEDDVRHVVSTSDKQRYRLSLRCAHDMEAEAEEGDATVLCVRANQGHSIPNIDFDRLLTRLSTEEVEKLETVVHGTFLRAWREHIQAEGLSRMTRNHIHFATGMPEDRRVVSGMRKSCELFIFLDVKQCARAGVEFFRSDNGVILTAGVNNRGVVPPSFFSRVVSSSGDILMEGNERQR